MNFTTPHAPDDIAVLRGRQVEATKRRLIAELLAHKIARATLQYRAEPFSDREREVNINAIDAELADGTTIILGHPLDATLHDNATLLERFALDAVAHKHPHFPQEAGGYGTVVVHADKGTVHIVHTDYTFKEARSECDL